MRRNMTLSFPDDEEWSTVLEFFRRLRKVYPMVGKSSHPEAELLAAHAREFLDAPQAAKNGEPKP